MWIWGIISIASSIVLAGRLIWEETVWTWERGPQMIGFSLAHSNEAVLLLSMPLLWLWVIVALVLIGLKAFKRRRIGWRTWTLLGCAVFVSYVLMLPDAFWQRAFVGHLAASPYAADDLAYAAVERNFPVVKALIAHGVPVDAADESGATALRNAAFVGDLQEVQYLVSHGANVNALNLYGDSPLEEAASQGHKDVAIFLMQHGAKRIRGTDEQRQKASQEIVNKEIEKSEGIHIKPPE